MPQGLRICAELAPRKREISESPDFNAGLAINAVRIEAIRAPPEQAGSLVAVASCARQVRG